ncbi:Wzz/FepE/Etk N-terminal domain-containing protein, partial [Paraburkholderia sp. A1RO-1]
MTFQNQNRIIDLPDDDEIRLSEHLTVIREGWRPIAYVAVAFLLIGSLYAVLATPQYRADAMIQVEDGTGSVNDA